MSTRVSFFLIFQAFYIYIYIYIILHLTILGVKSRITTKFSIFLTRQDFQDFQDSRILILFGHFLSKIEKCLKFFKNTKKFLLLCTILRLNFILNIFLKCYNVLFLGSLNLELKYKNSRIVYLIFVKLGFEYPCDN